jgi:RNA polymerase II subunit A C-terminal domain phosphatase SSU72
MLKRNLAVKEAPERFQDTDKEFDIIITFEDRVFDIVAESMSGTERRRSECLMFVAVFIICNWTRFIFSSFFSVSRVFVF